MDKGAVRGNTGKLERERPSAADPAHVTKEKQNPTTIPIHRFHPTRHNSSSTTILRMIQKFIDSETVNAD